jgi:hypothetical protein
MLLIVTLIVLAIVAPALLVVSAVVDNQHEVRR